MSATPSHSRRGSTATRTPGASSPRKAQRTPIAKSVKDVATPGEDKLAKSWNPASSYSAAYRNPLSSSQAAAAVSNRGASTSAQPMEPLNFSSMYNKIDNFMVTFKAFISGELAATEMLREEHESGIALDREEINGLQGDVEDAKKEQSQLWDTIKSQKEADASERADIAKLKGTQSSLQSRKGNLEKELAELAHVASLKRTQQDERRQQLLLQRGKNRGELERLSMLVGVEIRPTKIADQLKIVYNLLDPDDFEAESSFVLEMDDAQGRGYSVLACNPSVEAARLAELVKQLNKSRNPYEFIKCMRVEFKKIADLAREKRRGLS